MRIDEYSLRLEEQIRHALYVEMFHDIGGSGCNYMYTQCGSAGYMWVRPHGAPLVPYIRRRCSPLSEKRYHEFEFTPGGGRSRGE